MQVAGNRVLAAGTKTSMIRTAASGTSATQQAVVTTKAATTTPTKQIAIAAAPSTTAATQLKVDVPQSPTKAPQQHVMIRQQIAGTQVVQKVAAQPGTVVVSGGQVFAPGQIVVSGNQVMGTPTQVSLLLYVFDYFNTISSGSFHVNLTNIIKKCHPPSQIVLQLTSITRV